jgi:hypothetical protein
MSIVSISRRETRISADPETLETARLRLRENFHIVLPSLVEPTLLEWIQTQVAQGVFVPKEYHRVGPEWRMEENGASGLLNVLLNDAKLQRFVEAVAGCEPVGRFLGRVYQMRESRGGFGWHDDRLDEDGASKVVGISLNLGREAFTGGVFEIRRKQQPEVIFRHANIVPGDAILFLIDENLQHRVTPVLGPVCKQAFAGWFMRLPADSNDSTVAKFFQR